MEYAEVVAEGQKRDIRNTLRAVEEFRRVGVTLQQRLERLAEIEVNCISLAWAQEAVFVVCLDDEDKKSSPAQNWSNAQNYEEDLVLRGKHILSGGGSRRHGVNRWYDATIQLVVGSSGTSGLCIEHSAAEGIVIINMAESALRYERDNRKRNLISRAEREIGAKPLTWHVDAEAMRLLEKQKVALDE
ncbi:hypothetical protein ANCCEY_10233 [Ancylostoma ceylanicum]|uniref:Choline/carnitine acyltransferase domain-containing protein n=1 Tax=Ancylostoma ceylanicum TaxID=53326 RepID=A0A0D6LF07_9BILA|nr:hypothetical protein ANCCEY_10233 [Ancylostoma ceylanicum]